MAWTPIVGRGFTAEEFREYAKTVKLGTWKPEFVVVHNTSAPRLSQWHSHPGEVRMKNLENYYKNEQKWSSGPNLFVADDKIWVFTPINHRGTHSPSWNAISLGVEMVGEYDEEAFDSGPGARVRDNTVSAVATLCELYGLDSVTIRFHREDPKTTHKHCPGKNVVKAKFVKAVHDEKVRRLA